MVFAQETIIKNGDFESRLSRWSKTGSSTLAVESATPLADDYSANWDASATGEFLRSNTYTIPAGLKGISCSLEMQYIWDTGTSGHLLLNVDDGTNNIAQLTVSPTTSAVSKKAMLNFECPTSGSLRYELESTADADSIRVDSVKLGKAGNSVSISQAVFAGESYFAGTTACAGWTRTSTTLGAFSTDADCPGPTIVRSKLGTWLTTDANLPRQTISDLPPGLYKATFQAFGLTTATANTAFAINDGTTTCEATRGSAITSPVPVTVTCSFEYTTTASRTFELYVASESSTVTMSYDTITPRASLKFILEKYPLSSAEALTLETTGVSWSGYHNNTCSFTRANTAYGDPTADASCALVERQNSGFGAVSSSGSVLPNIVFTPRQSGMYWVCAQAKVRSSTTTADMDFRLWDGTTVIAESRQNEGESTDYSTIPLCGLYYAATTSSVTLSIQSKASAGSATIQVVGTENASAIEWSIYPITQQFPAPVFTELQNLMKGSNSGLYRTVSARISNAGTPTVAQQDGTWISSLTDSGTGDTTINITSGIFSQPPNCVCNTYGTGLGNALCRINDATAISSTLVRVLTGNTAATAVDLPFMIICTGQQ